MKKFHDLKKKLNLSRETLRSLEATHLEKAVGGVTANCTIKCTISHCTDCACNTDSCTG